MLILLGKIWKQLFNLQLWLNIIGQIEIFNIGMTTGLGEKKWKQLFNLQLWLNIIGQIEIFNIGMTTGLGEKKTIKSGLLKPT